MSKPIDPRSQRHIVIGTGLLLSVPFLFWFLFSFWYSGKFMNMCDGEIEIPPGAILVNTDYDTKAAGECGSAIMILDRQKESERKNEKPYSVSLLEIRDGQAEFVMSRNLDETTVMQFVEKIRSMSQVEKDDNETILVYDNGETYSVRLDAIAPLVTEFAYDLVRNDFH